MPRAINRTHSKGIGCARSRIASFWKAVTMSMSIGCALRCTALRRGALRIWVRVIGRYIWCRGGRSSPARADAPFWLSPNPSISLRLCPYRVRRGFCCDAACEPDCTHTDTHATRSQQQIHRHCALRTAQCSVLSAQCSVLSAQCSVLSAQCSVLSAQRRRTACQW
jgi:hypothetical protein